MDSALSPARLFYRAELTFNLKGGEMEKMKKKIYLAMFFAALLIFISVRASLATPAVSLSVMDSSIIVGETFDVEVWADGDNINQQLLAFGFDVITPGTYFSYTGYTIEAGFDDFSDPSNPDNVCGAYDFLTPLGDDVHLATLSFNAIDVGTDNLTALGLYDWAFDGLYYEWDGYDIDPTINITVNPIPEPSTILLLCLGLFGLVGLKGKYKNS